MAINMMCDASKEGQANVVRVDNYPGHEVTRMQHNYDCPHSDQEAFASSKGCECTDKCHFYAPLFIETTHEGCVIRLYEINSRDDSDFYALVWDEPAQCLLDIKYATTRGWSYPNTAKVDATPEVLAKAVVAQAESYYADWRRMQEVRCTKLEVNREVEVFKGRKLKAGTRGVIEAMSVS